MALEKTRIYIDKNVWHEQQPDGTQKWFALHPETGETVEIEADQAYFYTEAWQAGERKVDEHLAAGRYKDFDDVYEFFDTRIS